MYGVGGLSVVDASVSDGTGDAVRCECLCGCGEAADRMKGRAL